MFIFVFLLTAVFAGLSSVSARLRPVLSQMAVLEATNTALLTVNGVISDSVMSSGVTYRDIVTLAKDLDGNVTALQVDMPFINRLRADIESRIVQSVSGGASSRFSIPLGSLFDVPLLSGTGPGVPVKIASVSSVQTQLVSTFEGAGINQTRHRVAIFITMTVEIRAPGAKTSAEISTEVGIAETVIVGTVPERYLNSGRTAGSLEEAVFNYFAIN